MAQYEARQRSDGKWLALNKATGQWELLDYDPNDLGAIWSQIVNDYAKQVAELFERQSGIYDSFLLRDR